MCLCMLHLLQVFGCKEIQTMPVMLAMMCDLKRLSIINLPVKCRSCQLCLDVALLLISSAQALQAHTVFLEMQKFQ